ncbi:MAG: DUF2218 domain-containing protein [Proteobacteria bacterium]|nr:DUF2218 domain-containing protein [Pseudomonadota bacterium]
MTTFTAVVPTASASRYLQQLCKHWAHKFPVEFTTQHGEIELPLGRCALDAGPDALTVSVKPGEAFGLDRIRAVVEDHLKRFAFRETLEFRWTLAA